MAFLAGAALAFAGGLGAGGVVLRRIGTLQTAEDEAGDAASQAAGAKSVVFVLGGPGSGKGTNCDRIVKEFGYTHLSAGDLLRQERRSGSKLGDLIEEYIREGNIVPSEITVKLLLAAMEASGGSRFLIDGFPRNQANLDAWNAQVQDCEVACVLVLECSEAVMEQRLLLRGQTSGRSDDNSSAIKKRFRTHREETLPIIAYYDQLGKTRQVDSGREIDTVYADVQAVFRDLAAPNGTVAVDVKS
uniref:UMP-CMP kinase n=1 Tax=Rhizochromulina marina TaxID=1034831 RepID=A0A7S2S0N2_9STRA